MAGKRIQVTIDENGQVVVETIGFAGRFCVDESRWVKEIVGAEIARELKPCYYSTSQEIEKKRHLPICG